MTVYSQKHSREQSGNSTSAFKMLQRGTVRQTEGKNAIDELYTNVFLLFFFFSYVYELVNYDNQDVSTVASLQFALAFSTPDIEIHPKDSSTHGDEHHTHTRSVTHALVKPSCTAQTFFFFLQIFCDDSFEVTSVAPLIKSTLVKYAILTRT